MIINLSDLFDITIDELLRSDDRLEEKVIQDSKRQIGWQSYVLIGVGVLIGILIIRVIKHGEINWMSIGNATGVAALLFLIYFLLLKGIRRVEQKG